MLENLEDVYGELLYGSSLFFCRVLPDYAELISGRLGSLDTMELST